MTSAIDSRPDTYAHIAEVRGILNRAIKDLIDRAHAHDASKLESPELEAFDEISPRLREMTVGSEEYERTRAEFQGALDHHYVHNKSHHPDALPRGIRSMSTIDLTELVADWMAAAKRHDDGDVRQSVEILQPRFGYSDELKEIILNTIDALEAA